MLNLSSKWRNLWGEARMRILLSYLGIILVFMGIAIPLIRQKIFVDVDRRVKVDMTEEMDSFIKLLSDGPGIEDIELVNRLRNNTPIPNNYPQDIKQLELIFKIHLNRRIPEDDMFLISFINQEMYQSSPRSLPSILRQDSVFMERWATLTKAEQGEQQLPNTPYQGLLYTAKPIKINDEVLGVFVVAHTTAGERDEALTAFHITVQSQLIALGLALGLGWWVVGGVLAPLRTLSKTAHQISETDLSQRLVADGNGEMAQLSRTFNEMMERLESAFQSQRDFLNDVGHELRTPITIIQGHLELMGDDAQEIEETVALVLDELNRMNRLVNDLLLLAKAERIDFLRSKELEISSLMEEIYLKARALSSEHNWFLENKGSGLFWGDRQRLTEAIVNLSENAVRHTASDGKIILGSDVTHNQVLFWVRDTGKGIPISQQEKVFERFVRFNSSEGTGLGLAIVKAIAEAHGGTVKLISKPEIGSTFIVVLPKAISQSKTQIGVVNESYPYS
jgi:signal transduction histidine kinase